MVGSLNLQMHTGHISARIPSLSTTKYEPLELDHNSINSDSDDSLEDQGVHTIRSWQHRHQTSASTGNLIRSKSAHQRNSIESRPIQHVELDPINNYHRLKSAKTLISIDSTPFQKFTPTTKIIQVHEDFTSYLHGINCSIYR